MIKTGFDVYTFWDLWVACCGYKGLRKEPSLALRDPPVLRKNAMLIENALVWAEHPGPSQDHQEEDSLPNRRCPTLALDKTCLLGVDIAQLRWGEHYIRSSWYVDSLQESDVETLQRTGLLPLVTAEAQEALESHRRREEASQTSRKDSSWLVVWNIFYFP